MASCHSQLKALAQGKGLTLPGDLDPKAKALQARLSKLAGDAFDRSYMQAMLTDHRQAVADFRRESIMGKDAEIKAFAGRTLPTLEEHLKMAMGTSHAGVGTSGGNRKTTGQ